MKKQSHRLTAKRGALGASLALAGAMVLAGCGTTGGGTAGASSKPPIKIGVAVGETGYLSSKDIPFSEGAQLAVQAINKAGGVDGHLLKLYVVNMDSSATTGVTATNQLLTQDGVDVMLAGSVSAATAAEAPLVTNHQVPMIAASVLPTDSQWIFSTLQPASKGDDAALGFVKSVLHVTSIGVVYSETPYGQESNALMATLGKTFGINVVASEGVPTNATDITPALQKIKASGAKAIIDVLSGPIHVVEAKDAASLGLNLPIVMSQDVTKTIKEASAAYPDTYFVTLPPQIYPHESNAAMKAALAKFIPYYKKAYGSAPGLAYAARGWDSIQILAKAVRASGAITGTKLDNALANVSYTGTVSEYAYTPTDHTGQKSVPNPMDVAQFQGSQINVVYTPQQ